MLGNLSLNDIPFTILRAATSDEEEELKVSLIEIDERFSALDSMMESRNIPNVSQFYKKKHCFTNNFQIRKYDDKDCTFHKPIRGSSMIGVFPDTNSHELDGVLHYQPGSWNEH